MKILTKTINGSKLSRFCLHRNLIDFRCLVVAGTTNHSVLNSCKREKFNDKNPTPGKPRHLICFNQWTTEMVLDVLNSALNLKKAVPDTHQKRFDFLKNIQVAILQEVNEPILGMAITKAAVLMGGHDRTIVDSIMYDESYEGRIYSAMADIIFVSTTKHLCVQRFADKSTVPVLCMLSRSHATIQSLATVMAIMETYGTMKSVNLAYVGSPHQVLNSYLLLCPMLGANIKFMCCCKEKAVSPILRHLSEILVEKTHTVSKQCMSAQEAMENANVIIAGPATKDPDKRKLFELSHEIIAKSADKKDWIFFHTGPRSKEVDEELFNSKNAKTFTAFENLHYIAAALMAYTIKGTTFTQDSLKG